MKREPFVMQVGGGVVVRAEPGKPSVTLRGPMRIEDQEGARSDASE